MKNLIIFLGLFLYSCGFAQKTVYIANTSSYNVVVGTIATYPNGPIGAGSTYMRSTNPASFTVAAGAIETLQNNSSATKFPFYSPDGTLHIYNWTRYTPTSTVSLTATNAYTLYGSGQRFGYLKLNGASPYVGIGPSSGPTAYGSGWAAEYSVNIDPNNPSLQETVILIYDTP